MEDVKLISEIKKEKSYRKSLDNVQCGKIARKWIVTLKKIIHRIYLHKIYVHIIKEWKNIFFFRNNDVKEKYQNLCFPAMLSSFMGKLFQAALSREKLLDL